MGDQISVEEFGRSEGTSGWQAASDARAVFRTGSFDVGAALVARIAELADAANHHPDIDLRYGSVTVRLTSHDVGGLSQRDAALARDISAAARELGVEVESA
jgi:4a-hydroxytetrahydrobiopterin dehydratase